MELILRVALISFFVFISCRQPKINNAEVKLSDTTYAFQVFLDSFFTYEYDKLRNPRAEAGDSTFTSINQYFEGNDFGDSLIFLKDSIFSEYIPTSRYKIKFLTYTEICNLLFIHEKTQRHFPSILKINYYHFKDSIFNVWLDQNYAFYTKNSKGAYKENPAGGYYDGNDTCIISGNCLSTFSMNFIKTNSGLRIEK